MEKLFKTSSSLASGKQLLAIALRGSASFKKALGYSEHKWDSKLGKPKDSGSTIEDVVYYVQKKMWVDQKKKSQKRCNGCGISREGNGRRGRHA